MSGGITGTTSRIIHSGRAPDSRKASISFRRFTSFLRLASEPVSRSSSRTVTRSSSSSREDSIFFIASAPIIASKESSPNRSEEHTSELQSLMRNSYAVFCLKKKKTKIKNQKYYDEQKQSILHYILTTN